VKSSIDLREIFEMEDVNKSKGIPFTKFSKIMKRSLDEITPIELNSIYRNYQVKKSEEELNELKKSLRRARKGAF
jgi:hypothetical protein